MGSLAHCSLSIDLEDYKHATSRFIGVPETCDPESAWRGLDRLTEVLRAVAGAQNVTFFTTGQVARAQPDLVAELVRRGHEIGCHGDVHDDVWDMSEEGFSLDLKRAVSAIGEASGRPVLGFRAPNFSIDPRSTWVYRVLREQGFLYDSSLQVSERQDPTKPYDTLYSGGAPLYEFPIYRRQLVRGVSVRVIGGTYFRFLPTRTILALMREAVSCGFLPMIYLHFSDLDPAFDRVRFRDMHSLPISKRLIWGLRQQQWRMGTRSTCAKLRQVLSAFSNCGPLYTQLPSGAQVPSRAGLGAPVGSPRPSASCGVRTSR